ncbi:MAG TPA: HU family DNA-binding protein [bacterium]|nr:HU family DNA-binding protein [bacterium]
MTKSEMLSALAEKTGFKKKDVQTLMLGLNDLIYKTLKKEKQIKLDGLGVFQLKDRKARMGRNPATGETIKIAAKRVVKFRVIKALKDEVLGK